MTQAADYPTTLAEFTAAKPYPLDPFQLQACEALDRGENVLVVAPTGSGKTLVGEYAIHRALAAGRRVFYTTPLKALSNQKFDDLSEQFGAQNVGLLTGDISLRGMAPVVVMTTEILRNMIYADSPDIDTLDCVILDEVHFLADALRGPIWEEIVITAPARIQFAALSATVSNATEVADWLRQVRGPTELIATSHRPVPLYNHVLYNGRLMDLLAADGRSLNPAVARQQLIKDHRRARPTNRSRATVVQELDKAGLLPAIFFIFSRAGCEAAVQQCLSANLRLISPQAVAHNLAVLDEHCQELTEADREALGYSLIRAGIERGFAPHHAGLLPAFRLAIEHLFAEGSLRLVFATETLALGINMPARTVVLDRLDKWNGVAHEDITPGEYIQLTGRAGRRGIDIEGHAVVSTSGQARPRRQLALVTAKPGPLISAFRPSYNMAVNLLAHAGVSRSRELLQSSFAQFQADRSVVTLAAQVRRHEAELAPLAEQLTCELGDLPGYFDLRRRLSALEAEQSRAAAADRRDDKEATVAALRPGDVIEIPRGRWKGRAVVLDAKWDGRGNHPRRRLLLERGEVRDVEVRQLAAPLDLVGQVRIRSSFNPRVAAQRRDLLSAMRELERTARRGAGGRAAGRSGERAMGDGTANELGPQIVAVREELRSHPCHRCPDMAEHEQLERRAAALRAELADMTGRIEAATDSLAAAFTRICGVLEDLGFVRIEGERAHVSDDGERLRSLYADHDLLLALALREGVFALAVPAGAIEPASSDATQARNTVGNGPAGGAGRLDPAEYAAALSGLVAERRGDARGRTRTPLPPAVKQTRAALESLNADLTRREKAARLPERRDLDFSLAGSMLRWLRGGDLSVVVADAEMTAGDFLRAAGQLEDQLGQLARLEAAGGRRGPASEAHALIRPKLAAFRR